MDECQQSSLYYRYPASSIRYICTMARARKILTVTPGLSTGGVQRTSVNYAIGYAHAGRDSRVLVSNDGPMRSELEAADVPVWMTRTDPRWDGLESRLPEIERWNPDAVHIHAQWVTTRVVEILRSVLPSNSLFIETNIWGEPTPFRQFIDVSCQLSEWSIWAYKQHHTSQNSQPHSTDTPLLVTVPNSVDVDTFYPSTKEERRRWREEHGIPPSAFVMGRVGQSYPGKSHPAPLTLVCQLRERGIDAWFVSIAPSDEFREVAATANDTVQSHVRMLDRIDDGDELRKAYGAFDVFLHVTTQGETFGNVLAEAQACKVPVVTRLTPHRDNAQCITVPNGEAGFVVAKWRKLFNAVLELATTPELSAQMGENGYERVRSLYANEVVTERLLTILDCGVVATSRDDFRERLRKAGILSGEPVSVQMAQNFADCYGGLPFYWALWNRFDRTTGFGFRVARKLDHWRQRLAERHVLNLPKS